jgi:predicted nucleotide-binding protein
MARKSSEPPRGDPNIPPSKGIELIKRQIEAGNALLNQSLDSATYSSWENTTKIYLEKAFGNNHPNATKLVEYGKFGSFPVNAPPQWWANWRAKNLQGQLTLLDGFIDVLKTEAELAEPRAAAAIDPERTTSRKIFLVHGHETGLQQTIARFLERLALEVVILDEQPSQGRTIFQKFSDHSDVGFAVVLLTGDDIGGKKDTPPADLSPRARQNVILELGYFLGKLGPARVCALYQSGVEIPSDIAGVVYVSLEGSVDWRLKLASEIKAAKIDVDMNRLY